MKFEVPTSLNKEHEELHQELLGMLDEPGRIGKAAAAVAEILHPHFVKEEEYALPPLGLLRTLAEKGVTQEMEGVLEMTDKLKSELKQMLLEHKAIVAELEALADAIRDENRSEFARFPEKLKLHAQTEEEVLYPASILVGEIVRMKLIEPMIA